MSIFVVWFLRFAVAELILSVVQYGLRKKKFKAPVRALLIAGKFLFAIACAVLVLAGPVSLRPAQPTLTALYLAFFADAAADAVYSVFLAAKKSERKFAAAKTVSIVFGAAWFVFGVLNMQHITPVGHVYTSEKLEQTHTFIFAADIHVGSAQPMKVNEKLVKEMTDAQPDFIILGGDVTDDYTTKAEAEEFFGLFADCGIPVYYIYGNHDRQLYADHAYGRQFSEKELLALMTDNGITVLSEQTAAVADDLCILGREDLSLADKRLPADKLPAVDKNDYLIVVDHQPTDAENNAALGADLQLSGHTHAGQLFPLRFFYDLFICDAGGEYTHGDMDMIVSSGTCGWRFPCRTDSGCHYEIITLQPAAEK